MSKAICTIIGNVVRDAEVRKVGENDVCSFTVAVGTSFKDKAKNEYIDNFYSVTIWGAYGVKLSENLKKGAKVMCNGEIGLVPYTTKAGTQGSGLNMKATVCEVVQKSKTAEAAPAGEDELVF